MVNRSSVSRLMQGSVQALWRALSLNLILFFAGTIAGLYDLSDDDLLSARDAPLSVGAIILLTAAALILMTWVGWVLIRSTRRPGTLFGWLALVLAGTAFTLLLQLHHLHLGIRITLGLMVAATTWSVWGWLRPTVKRRRVRSAEESVSNA